MGNLVPPPPPQQADLFDIDIQIEFDGIEMGVLENGVPYLSESGLARMCGVNRTSLNNLARDWGNEQYKPRGKQIKQLLSQAGYAGTELFLKSNLNGIITRAYPGHVCMAILEYYAFLSNPTQEKATQAFRSLARTSFRTFVYDAVGYTPESRVLDSWKHFHDRVDLNYDSVPLGYFSVFKEISGMIVTLIRSNVLISDKVVPDLSVCSVWGKCWSKEGFNKVYGERVKYVHNYPEYYRQALSNPQEAWAYPDAALAKFREWFREEYILRKFPNYLINQAKQGKITNTLAKNVIYATTPAAIADYSTFNKGLETALDYNPKD